MSMRRRATLLAAGLLLPALASPRPSKRPEPACGSFPARAALELGRHRDFLRRHPPAYRSQTQAQSEDTGELALVEADGSIVAEANPFDLAERSVDFLPAGTAYRKTGGGEPLASGIGQRQELGDDDTRELSLLFEFPFYGARYRRVFLNSDGNLTFERGDDASTERSLSRVLTGPPRIAAFFADLDPSAGGEVRVESLADRLVVTWEGVPEFEKPNRNSFQVVLEESGAVRLRFSRVVEGRRAVVGIAPGGNPDRVELLDLGGEDFTGDGALAERFLDARVIDHVAAVRRFFQTHADRHEMMVMWTNFDADLDGAFAFEITVQNAVEGIGVRRFNDAASWGSAGRLQSFVQMGNLHRYPAAPEQRLARAGGRPTTLALLAHETGHRWLATVQFDDQGRSSQELLGRQLAHWSFFMSSEGSFLEGNDIEEQMDGRFRTVNALARYSRLDLYLMGLAPLGEVAPFFYLANGSGRNASGDPVDPESSPEVGVTLTGQKKLVTVEDVIRREGSRRPSFDAAPKEFRQAWVILFRPENPPTSEEIARVEAARTAWERFFQEHTLGRGNLTTALNP